jgi:hypothetical protein
VLVVTPERSVAHWAAKPIHTGPGASVFVPLVLGPEQIPRVTDAELAARLPELAVLSARAHRREPDALQLAQVALDAFATLEEERAMLYCDYVVGGLGPSARRQLEEQMQIGQWRWRSEFARRYVNQGRKEGHAEGRAQGEADAVLRVLRARGLQVTAEQEARIRACTELPTLEAWLDRAVAVSSVDELLAP